jgi:hypothetical protein
MKIISVLCLLIVLATGCQKSPKYPKPFDPKNLKVGTPWYVVEGVTNNPTLYSMYDRTTAQMSIFFKGAFSITYYYWKYDKNGNVAEFQKQVKWFPSKQERANTPKEQEGHISETTVHP